MLRSQILYVAPYGGESLRVRSASKMYACVRRFLDQCTDAGPWPRQLELEVCEKIRPCTREDEQWHSLAQLDAMGGSPPDDDLSVEQAMDQGHHERSTLVQEAIALLGPPEQKGSPVRVAVKYSDKRTRAVWPWCWDGASVAEVAPRVLEFVQRHQKLPKLKYEEYGDEKPFWPQVEVTAYYDFRLTEPGGAALLPYQHERHYLEEWQAQSSLQLNLGHNTLILELRLPFADVDAEFVRFYDAASEALGRPLPERNLRLNQPNKKGTAYFKRKLGFKRSDWA